MFGLKPCYKFIKFDQLVFKLLPENQMPTNDVLDDGDDDDTDDSAFYRIRFQYDLSSKWKKKTSI